MIPYLNGLNQFLTQFLSLKLPCKNAIDWFRLNTMIENPEKFQSILLNKSDLSNLQPNVNEKALKSVLSVILDITLDDKLNFNLHINSICTPGANQQNPATNLQIKLKVRKKWFFDSCFMITLYIIKIYQQKQVR